MLKELDDLYLNFHFIFKYSVQDWILNSDFINFWFSTSIVECYSLNKPCNILRPVEIDEYFDVPFYINANHITDYESFNQNNLNNFNEFPISPSEIKVFYDSIDDEKFVYKKLCDYIEKMINDDSFKRDYYYRNPFFENLMFCISRLWTGRFFSIVKNSVNDTVNAESKNVFEEDYEKIMILKEIVDENFD